MRVTYGDVRRGAPSIEALTRLKLKPRAALTLARVSKAINAELETLEEARQKLLKEHGAFLKAETDAKYSFHDGEGDKFEADWRECLGAEVELPFGALKLDELGLPEIEPALLEPIMWLFD